MLLSASQTYRNLLSFPGGPNLTESAEALSKQSVRTLRSQSWFSINSMNPGKTFLGESLFSSVKRGTRKCTLCKKFENVLKVCKGKIPRPEDARYSVYPSRATVAPFPPALHALTSRPAPPRPVPSHPAPSRPVPFRAPRSRRKVRLCAVRPFSPSVASFSVSAPPTAGAVVSGSAQETAQSLLVPASLASPFLQRFGGLLGLRAGAYQ